MADKEPPQLNPAAATSIPPPEQPRPRRHRGRRCCSCLFRTFWILFVTILLLACLLILVVWILIQPRSFTYRVSQATLTEFNYTPSTATLRHNLVLNFTVRNPNRKIKIYYDVVQAHALYRGVLFATTDVTMPWRASYLQEKKSTVPMSAVFSGQRVMAPPLDSDRISAFEEDAKSGAFDIDTKIHYEIRFRLGDFQFGIPNPRGKCKVRVPLTSSDDKNGKTVMEDAFEPTKCDVDF